MTDCRSTEDHASAPDRAATERGQGLVVVSGPSGVGKSTLVRSLLVEMPKLRFSVSATTRSPRPGEEDGREYHFLDEATFRRGIAEGRFIEHAEVFGNLYGTPLRELELARAEGKWLLLEIDVHGGLQIRRRYPEALLILVTAPSLDEIRRRLENRGTEPPEVVERRFAEARSELDTARESGVYNARVVNQTVPEAVNEIRTLIEQFGRDWE